MLTVPTKQQLYDFGIAQTKHFLDVNNLAYPEFITGRAPHAMNKWQNIGLCVGKRIWVDIDKTTMPRLTRGRVWSWPGYKADRTAMGVVAHETAHYISHQLNVSRGPLAQAWLDILRLEKPISSYEPTPEEAFAEAGRLFILNPDLLKCGRALRYEFFRQLGLKPIVFQHWGHVLREAPVHIQQAAAKFAGFTQPVDLFTCDKCLRDQHIDCRYIYSGLVRDVLAVCICPCGLNPAEEVTEFYTKPMRFTDWSEAHRFAQQRANDFGIDQAIRRVFEYGKLGYNVSSAAKNDSDYALAEIVRPSERPRLVIDLKGY